MSTEPDAVKISTDTVKVARDTLTANNDSASNILIEMRKQSTAMQGATSAATAQSRIAQESLNIGQRAYVTIGRKDGVVADFIIPKDLNENAEVVIYFQNSGHLPATFRWGTLAPFINVPPNGPRSSGIIYTHPYQGRMIRTRDKKSGSIGGEGETTTIAGDSVFVSTMGMILHKDLAALSTSGIGIMVFGEFEYCDDIGTHSLRRFVLRYRSNAPAMNLSFDLASDSAVPIFPLPKPTATTEYLPPCETSAERAQNRKKAITP